MRAYCGRDSLMPLGLVTDHVEIGPDKITATARSSSTTAACPACGNISAQVHSRYHRCLADVPAHGRLVEIRLEVRRFRCRQRQCSIKIFGERLCEGITRPFARRTSRLESLARHLGLALGGRPGQNLARRLLLPLSKDTLLRIVRLYARKAPSSPTVVGIDDWAWKRGHRYGTIICDLEQRRVIDLLPDREMATLQAWLADRPSIRTISRDRGGGYATFAFALGPVALIGLVITIGLVALLHRGEFAGGGQMTEAGVNIRVNRVLVARALVATALMVALFFLGQPPAKAAIIIGGLLLLTRRVKSERVYAEIDWSLLLMFAGLFIIVAGAQHALSTPDLIAQVGRMHLDQVPILSGVTAVLSNLVSNVPAVLLMKPFVQSLPDHGTAWLTIAMASTLAGNFTILGSIANLIVVQKAATRGVVIGRRGTA